MRIRSPASHGSFSIRFSWFDAAWALITPLLALGVRGAPSLTAETWTTAAIYCGISFTFSMIAFLIFRIREGMTHLFSVTDALEVAKAVVLSELMTCLVLFSATRLDGIPRTTPVIHALLLSAGLMIARATVRMLHSERDVGVRPDPVAAQHVIIIGSNRLSSLYISFLRAYAPEQYRVIASLDDRPEMIGRSVAGVRVFGPVNHLLPIIEDFKDHGISTDRILVGGDPDLLTAEAAIEIQRICNEYEIQLDFIPRLIGLSAVQQVTAPTRSTVATIPAFSPPRYFRAKRVVDFCLSLVLIVVLLPVFVIVATLVLLDAGSPVFFWQRRIGRNGQSFQIHKFRTLKPSYDWQAQPLSSTERISWLGQLVRRVRLDELPQLLNVLVGDMSLIGPRPLLPRDQPPNPTVRLSVRPGITGWAQVHGGTLLTPEEKNMLDEWYVRNASIWVDLKIIAKTIATMLKGERRREPQPEQHETYTKSQAAPRRQSSVHGT